MKENSTSVEMEGASRRNIEPVTRIIYEVSRETGPLNKKYPENLNSEKSRIETFSISTMWPVSFISPSDCAKAGFFWLGHRDLVRCAFCGVLVENWKAGDDPLAKHKEMFKKCPFICNLPVGNIPMESSPSIKGENVLQVPVLTTSNENSNEAIPGAIHTDLAAYESRLQTFIPNWPDWTGQDAKKLAEAGFSYLGYSDNVVCFYCDGRLKNWVPDTEPWFEHQKWFPECPFLVCKKGRAHLEGVIDSGKVHPI